MAVCVTPARLDADAKQGTGSTLTPRLDLRGGLCSMGVLSPFEAIWTTR
jgi:hypothetical protein